MSDKKLTLNDLPKPVLVKLLTAIARSNLIKEADLAKLLLKDKFRQANRVMKKADKLKGLTLKSSAKRQKYAKLIYRAKKLYDEGVILNDRYSLNALTSERVD